jgi:hypothetical protein
MRSVSGTGWFVSALLEARKLDLARFHPVLFDTVIIQ